MKHTRFCFQSKTITYLSNLWCLPCKRIFWKGNFWNKWNGNKARDKKGNAHFPIDIHATDAAIAISSLDEGLEMQI
jgi:hypothetical protein